MANRSLTLAKKLALLILIASIVSGLFFLILQTISNQMIERYLSSEAYIKQQSAVFVEKFAGYVAANQLSSTDRDAFSEWTKKEENILLMIYKDNVLQYDSMYTAEDESGYGVEAETQFAKRNSYPVMFSDGKGDVIIDGFFSSRYFNLAYTIELLAAAIIFLSIVLLGIRSSLVYLRTINDDIHILEGGELEYTMTVRGYDELAMIAESIEELRKAFLGKLQAIEALQAESRSLVTEMSHDMRTPLTSLIMYLEFARNEQEKLSPDTRSYMNNAYGKALQLKNLSDNMFAYFLLDKEKEVELETLSVHEALYDVLSDLVGVLQQENFRIHTTGGLPDAHITVNMEDIGRVFDNLLSNLLKYADRHEEIGITYLFDQEVFEIHIRNTVKSVEAPVESTKLGEKIMDKMMSRMMGQFSISNDGITYESVLRFWNIKM